MSKYSIKHANRNLIVDFQSNQITFLDARFYRTQEGTFVPSVTTYLEAYPKSSAFYEWLKSVGRDANEIRDEAGRKGSAVHSMTERYDNGDEISLLDENGFIAYRMNEWSMFERYVEFRSSHEIDIVHNELNLVSSAFKMGGTIDRVMQVNGKLLLVDIKTSNAIHPHYWLQLAAYDRLLKAKLDLSVDGIAVLWLNAKTRTNGGVGDIQGKGWQLVIEKDKFKIEQFWRRFQACQDLWLAENESMKPKALQYSIVHKRAETKTL